MSETNKYVVGFGSDAAKDPRRIVFITRKTSAKVKGEAGPQLMSYPHLILREAIVLQVLIIVLVAVALFWDAPLEQLANPLLTPNPAKAPWYFLGLQEMLVYFDPWIAGVVMPTLIIIGLMIIPYIDANPLGSGYYTLKQRKFAIGTFCVGFMLLWLLMVVIGTFIRGPGWMWFWPGQTWDPSRVVFEVNRDLPDLFGISAMWGKILLGAMAMGLYFAAAGFGLHKIVTATAFNRKVYARMSFLQYATMQVFLIMMLLLPIKILIRHLFRIKYIWVTPWFNV